jgi:hypothetical protein
MLKQKKFGTKVISVPDCLIFIIIFLINVSFPDISLLWVITKYQRSISSIV